MDGKFPVIILAAGDSQRAGAPKGLIVVEGQAWLERQLDKLAERGAHRVVLVLGKQWKDYVKTLAWLPATSGSEANYKKTNVTLLINPNPDRGQFSSIQLALQNMSKEAGCFILPIDTPVPPTEVWKALVQSKKEAALPEFEGRGGHPTLLKKEIIKEMAELSLDHPSARLDAQLRLLGERVERVPVKNPDVLTNLNTESDWAN
jgi:molybdenum cofactor cytidylyltransferase